MLGKIVLLSFVIATCNADAQVSPPVICGDMPGKLFKCLGNPEVINHDAAAQCTTHASECEKIKCLFTTKGWMDGDKVNKKKVTEYFDQFAKDHPDWSIAVQQVKSNCLIVDLPAQGVYLNCPAYDVMWCSLTEFVKNAQPSVWTSSSECNYPRQFAAACPLCPEQCFAPQIPYGSCNACLLLPRSP